MRTGRQKRQSLKIRPRPKSKRSIACGAVVFRSRNRHLFGFDLKDLLDLARNLAGVLGQNRA
jgi:hypothetical protein